MRDMSNEEIGTIYMMAKSVFNNEKNKAACAKQLNLLYGTNINSFTNYFAPLYKYLINGDTFKGSVPLKLRKYYIEEIYREFGCAGLKNALKSYEGSITYYENRAINKPGDKKLYSDFCFMFDEYYICEEPNELFEKNEGLRRSVCVNKYERSFSARKKCIEMKGCICYVCGFDFRKKYGAFGEGFIHIHHIVPISSIGECYTVNYERDLVPVCPNCHAMLHKGKNKTVLSIEELKKIIDEEDKLQT